MTDDPEHATTIPIPIERGDRAVLERRIERQDGRIDMVIAELRMFVDQQDKRAAHFYSTRMVPNEVAQRRSDIRSGISIALAIVAIVGLIATVGIVIELLHGDRVDAAAERGDRR